MKGELPTKQEIEEFFTIHRSRVYKVVSSAILKNRKLIDKNYVDDLVHSFYIFLATGKYRYHSDDKPKVEQLFTRLNFYARQSKDSIVFKALQLGLTYEQFTLVSGFLADQSTPYRYKHAKDLVVKYNKFMNNLKKTTPKRYKAFERFQDLGSIIEASKELGESYETIKSHVRTASEQLRKEFADA